MSSPGFSFQMAEQLMTLAYDNGINLFDTAEVYAAGKYVSFLTGTVARPPLPEQSWSSAACGSRPKRVHACTSRSARFSKL